MKHNIIVKNYEEHAPLDAWCNPYRMARCHLCAVMDSLVSGLYNRRAANASPDAGPYTSWLGLPDYKFEPRESRRDYSYTDAHRFHSGLHYWKAVLIVGKLRSFSPGRMRLVKEVYRSYEKSVNEFYDWRRLDCRDERHRQEDCMEEALHNFHSQWTDS